MTVTPRLSASTVHFTDTVHWGKCTNWFTDYPNFKNELHFGRLGLLIVGQKQEEAVSKTGSRGGGAQAGPDTVHAGGAEEPDDAAAAARRQDRPPCNLQHKYHQNHL